MIKKVTINNFIGFQNFSAENLTPVNVIIGENDSGKTGLLKLLYGICKSLEEYNLISRISKESFKKVLSEKLYNTFQPRKNGLGELVYKSANDKLSVNFTSYDKETKTQQNLYFSFGERTVNTITDCSEHINEHSNFNALFIPAKEVLTAFEAIAATRENLLIPGFDDTYYDLIKALRIPTQKGKISSELTRVNMDLEELFEGVVMQGNKDMPFLFKKGNTEFTMPLTAEGIKKIGILTTLIRNRQLIKNTILFMDEPETALHPKAVRGLAEMIVNMSNAGVQIFITSHSYFMVKQLSIIARREQIDMNCFSLSKELNQPISVAIENMKFGLPDNPIITEALKMFDEDVKVELGI